MRVLVAGRYADVSGQGGATWAVLQLALGLRRLGHEVALVEPVAGVGDDVLAVRRAIHESLGLPDRIDAPDLLVNISGLLTNDTELEAIPVRLFVDLDPAFTQLWHEEGIDLGLDRHTHYATVGLGIGSTASIPTCCRDWITTLPPVVLERWPYADGLTHDGFTTIGNWRSYGPIHVNGSRYGQRAHSVRELVDLPERTGSTIMAAFSIHPDEVDDIASLRRHGWQLIDPQEVASTPEAYREFVQGSLAELGIAKEGYVVSGSGWFSDRSACYLASGRPVVTQDTGFSRHLPTGSGLLAFSDAKEAADAMDDVAGNYERHRVAAREIAEEHLDSDVVLDRLLRCL